MDDTRALDELLWGAGLTAPHLDVAGPLEPHPGVTAGLAVLLAVVVTVFAALILAAVVVLAGLLLAAWAMMPLSPQAVAGMPVQAGLIP